MRVALVNEGHYPHRTGVVGAWCHRLVRGLPEHEYHVVALLDSVTEGLYPPLRRTPKLTSLRLDGPPGQPRTGPPADAGDDLAGHAAVLLCRGMLDDCAHSAAMFRSALRRLVASDGGALSSAALPRILLDAWAAATGSRPPHPTVLASGCSPGPDANPLPDPDFGTARRAAVLVERAVRPIFAEVPKVDLCHLINGGPSTVVGLAAKWRDGTPFVVTEHRDYRGDPLLRQARGDRAVETLLLRFLRALSRLGYQEAAAILPPSERMLRWAMTQGADPGRVRLVPPGLDPRDSPVLRQEPDEPVIAWVGPAHERDLMLQAFEAVRAAVPEARLVVIGHPTEGPRCTGVSFTGPVPGRRALYAMAQVIAVSGSAPSMPYPLIEAMMCGRPTVCTDDGELADTVGSGAAVVPPADPGALAKACVTLLRDPVLRRNVSTYARQRALALFSLPPMIDAYRQAYADAVANAQPAVGAGSAGSSTRSGS